MSAHRLRHHLQHLTWDNIKNELSWQYSTIPSDSHITQAFAHLQQGPIELLEMYLHCASELLTKIHHMTDMSQILARGLNHYTVVYGLNKHN